MFIENKYTRWYYNIINRARTRLTTVYTEVHHVIPRCMGGTNDFDNLVKLTAREHFICHMLLVKMTIGEHRAKLLYAYVIMSGRRVYGNRQYALFRQEYALMNSVERSGPKNGMYGADRKGSKNTFFNRRHTAETKERIAAKKRGHSYNKGIPKSPEHRIKLGNARRNNARVFTFIHNIHGQFVGSILDIHEAFPDQHLRKDELWKMTSGMYKSYKGWIVHQVQTSRT
jgi:hypothetical protein